MKAKVCGLATVFLVAASAAHASGKTVIMNSIDASGVGKKIGTLSLSDTKTGLGLHRGSPICRRASMDSMSTSIPIAAQAAAPAASRPLE